MNTFEMLSENKGTISSALSKKMAKEVQSSQSEILTDCIDLSSYQTENPSQKNIRAGAAKVVEIIAEIKPDWVAPNLKKLLPALTVDEPQTRWMVLRIMGFCAHLNKNIAQQAIIFAEKVLLNKKDGLCLASSADLFLGNFGAISLEDAKKVFSILELSSENPLLNEQDWLLEAFYKIFPNLGKDEQDIVLKFAEGWQYSSRKSTQERTRKIMNLHRVLDNKN